MRITVAQRVPDVSWFRDSTQIVLPAGILDDYRDELEQRFMITVVDEQDTTRLIGSPVVIPEVREWLISKSIVVPQSE